MSGRPATGHWKFLRIELQTRSAGGDCENGPICMKLSGMGFFPRLGIRLQFTRAADTPGLPARPVEIETRGFAAARVRFSPGPIPGKPGPAATRLPLAAMFRSCAGSRRSWPVFPWPVKMLAWKRGPGIPMDVHAAIGAQ